MTLDMETQTAIREDLRTLADRIDQCAAVWPETPTLDSPRDACQEAAAILRDARAELGKPRPRTAA
jgi:hypothetical protein